MYAATLDARAGLYYPVIGRYGGVGTQSALAEYVGDKFAHIYILDGAPDGKWPTDVQGATELADGWYDARTASEEGLNAASWAEALFAEAIDKWCVRHIAVLSESSQP